MIIVRVELHSAITGKARELARMVIANDGSSTDPRIGNCTAQVRHAPKFQSQTRAAGLAGYRRLNRPVWDLVALMLTKMGYGDRN